MSLKIGVILGSTRPNRASEAIGTWFMEQAAKTSEATFELIDLKEINLPFFDEAVPPLMHQYANEHTKKWAAKIAELDGFIVITPEYNHSFPAVLKNAFDFLNAEWNKKPIGFVSYGSVAGGARAVEQFRNVAVELQMVPIKEQILIPIIWEAVQNNTLNTDFVKGSAEALLKEIIWWSKLLQTARQS